MPKLVPALSCVGALLALACGEDETSATPATTTVGAGAGGGGVGGGATAQTRFAFGSCMRQGLPKPVLDLALESDPDLFIFLGDNIYGDTDDMAVMEAKYQEQAASPELARLRDEVPTIATWDDHDYGRDDAGEEYPFKAESKELLLDFWQEPKNSERRMRDGLYTSYYFEREGGVVQVILLDMRWFRDPLDPNDGSGINDYQPTSDTTRTMLGEEQWTWLAEELAKPADVRIIGTSIQFGHEYNGWESWHNMPHERQRLAETVQSAGAEVTIFISGDAHWGELSRYQRVNGYPLYDLTSSGITESWPTIAANANRIGMPVAEHNYGFVEIAWGDADDLITLGIVDVNGVERIRHEILASELR